MGCAMWGFQGWENVVFPAGTPARERLRYYAERFSCVEGNTTFYGEPTPITYSNWQGLVSSEFRFS